MATVDQTKSFPTPWAVSKRATIPPVMQRMKSPGMMARAPLPLGFANLPNHVIAATPINAEPKYLAINSPEGSRFIPYISNVFTGTSRKAKPKTNAAKAANDKNVLNLMSVSPFV